MLTKVKTCAIVGLEGAVVEVEVDISPGLPAFNIVGLPDTSVQEARERVRAAIRNSGCEFPTRRITVSLAPADLKKEGPAYDLPIARDQGFSQMFVPSLDAGEGVVVEGATILPVDSLVNLVAHLRGEQAIEPKVGNSDAVDATHEQSAVDLAHVKGQEHAKRALEVAASGGHNLVMTGPPGSGKTLLARTLPSILPAMDSREALEVTKIYSISGLLPSDQPLIRQRPFRSPHYTASHVGLVGGGRIPRPGEITLAHRGVLFLDELPEFGHIALESLRQPMEDHAVTISRAQGNATFPANFMLVGALNPCPCGFYGDPKKQCSCTPSVVSRYQKRLSGPLIDRIDMFVEVPPVGYEKLTSASDGESSAAVRVRVQGARELQRRRFKGTSLICNAEMGPAEVWEYCQVEEGARGLLQAAMGKLNLSARGFHRVLKLSRTIADLAQSPGIGIGHVAEALQYRPRWVE